MKPSKFTKVETLSSVLLAKLGRECVPVCVSVCVCVYVCVSEPAEGLASFGQVCKWSERMNVVVRTGFVLILPSDLHAAIYRFRHASSLSLAPSISLCLTRSAHTAARASLTRFRGVGSIDCCSNRSPSIQPAVTRRRLLN